MTKKRSEQWLSLRQCRKECFEFQNKVMKQRMLFWMSQSHSPILDKHCCITVYTTVWYFQMYGYNKAQINNHKIFLQFIIFMVFAMSFFFKHGVYIFVAFLFIVLVVVYSAFLMILNFSTPFDVYHVGPTDKPYDLKRIFF